MAGLGRVSELGGFVNQVERIILLPRERCPGSGVDSVAIVSAVADRIEPGSYNGLWVLHAGPQGVARGRQLTLPQTADTLRAAVVEVRCHSRLEPAVSLLLRHGTTHLVYYAGHGYPGLRLVRDTRLEPATWSSVHSRFMAVQEERRDHEERGRAVAAERQRARAAWPRAFARAVDRQAVLVGMTPGMVRAAWGEPHSVNRTTTAAGASEQWVYGRGQYVYLRAGRVYAVQETAVP